MLIAVLLASAACKEEGTGVEVKSLSFTGVKSVSEKQLKSVLATTQSAKLPWGEKHFFDRPQFEADLQRIVASYGVGDPSARVRSFDAKLSEDQNSVRVTIDIVEGEPVVVERIDFAGLDSLPPDHRRALEQRFPIAVGRPWTARSCRRDGK